jgi:hypothetical protein
MGVMGLTQAPNTTMDSSANSAAGFANLLIHHKHSLFHNGKGDDGRIIDPVFLRRHAREYVPPDSLPPQS